MRKRATAPPEAEPGEDRQFVAAIARGFDILHAFRAEDPILGNQELAERTTLPRATVSRLTHTITRLGYLEYLPRFGKYRLGLAAVPLGQLALANMGIRAVAFSRIGSKWSKSSGSWSNSKLSGMPFMPQGLATGSKAPRSILPASVL